MDSLPPTSSSPSPSPPRNAATFHPLRLAAWAQLRHDVPTFSEACRLAVSGDASGHRLHWASAMASGSCDLPASRGAFFVVGRHSSCDVVLDADPCVALRHVMVRSSVLDDGCPVLSVLDLRTRDGFEIADGTVQRSVIATGPLAFRVGAYVLVAVPGAAVVSRTPWADAWREAVRHELTLSAGGRRASVRLSAADLDRGVLVGRDPRCIDSGLRAVLDRGISRVHLLLRRDARGTITAFDVASMQGTFVDRKRVRSVELADAGTTLTIGAVNPVRVDWRAV